MNYFQAKRAEALFTRYRQLALEFWEVSDREDGPGRNRFAALRQQLNQLFYTVNTNAAILRAGVTAQSIPPPAIGGAVIPVNFLRAVTDPNQGWEQVSREDSLDAIERCIGAAIYARRKARNRLLNPFCWLVDIPATIVRWPFLVMRKAGVSPKVEETVAAQVVKAVLTIALYAFLVYLGVVVTVGNLDLSKIGK